MEQLASVLLSAHVASELRPLVRKDDFEAFGAFGDEATPVAAGVRNGMAIFLVKAKICGFENLEY